MYELNDRLTLVTCSTQSQATSGTRQTTSSQPPFPHAMRSTTCAHSRSTQVGTPSPSSPPSHSDRHSACVSAAAILRTASARHQSVSSSAPISGRPALGGYRSCRPCSWLMGETWRSRLLCGCARTRKGWVGGMECHRGTRGSSGSQSESKAWRGTDTQSTEEGALQPMARSHRAAGERVGEDYVAPTVG